MRLQQQDDGRCLARWQQWRRVPAHEGHTASASHRRAPRPAAAMTNQVRAGAFMQDRYASAKPCKASAAH